MVSSALLNRKMRIIGIKNRMLTRISPNRFWQQIASVRTSHTGNFDIASPTITV